MWESVLAREREKRRCRECGEVEGKWGKECWDVGSVKKCVGRCGKVWGSLHTLLHFPHTSPHTLHTHPTPFPTPPILTPHLSPTPPHSPDTLLHNCLHSPHTFPHSLTLFHTPHTFPHFLPHAHLTPYPHLPQYFPTLTPYTSSQSPHLLQYFPILPVLYHLPHTKISHFSHLLPN